MTIQSISPKDLARVSSLKTENTNVRLLKICFGFIAINITYWITQQYLILNTMNLKRDLDFFMRAKKCPKNQS